MALLGLMLVVKNSYNLFALLLVVLALLVLASRSGSTPKWDVSMRWLAFIWLAAVVLAAAHWAAGRDTFSVVQRPLIMLSALPIMLAVLRLGVRTTFLYAGLALGMLGTVLIVGYQFHVQDLLRASNGYNPVPFSEVAIAACGVLLAAGLALRGRLMVLCSIGAIAALYCVLISGTRGTLLAVVPMALTLVAATWYRRKTGVYAFRSRHVGASLAVLLALLIIGAGAWNVSGFGDRFAGATSDIAAYSKDRAEFTSVGVRIELWRGVWISFQQHPWLGLGSIQRPQFLRDLESSGQIYVTGQPWSHAHSDYFDHLQLHGLPGLALICALYITLFVVFWRGLREAQGEQLAVALGGLLSVVAYASCSLSDTPLRTNLPLVFFTIHIAVLLGLLKRLQRAAT